jgi:hypothetical protein
MPKNCNSASRIVNLITSIPYHVDNTSTFEVWTQVFGLTELPLKKKIHVVAERLGSVSRELELVRAQMDERNFSPELYSPAIAHLEEACSTIILSGIWHQVRQHLTSEVIVVLSFCSEIIPDEEDLIAPEKLSSIAEQIDSLSQLLSTSQLPPRLRSLLQHHIELIQRALEEYPITGAKAFQRATQTGAGEAWDLREDIKRGRNEPEIVALGALWQEVRYETGIAHRINSVPQVERRPWNIFDAISLPETPIPSDGSEA